MTLRLLHSLPTRRSADLSFTQIVKPPVCTLRGSLSGKHSGRVFSLPFKGKNSCSIGKVTREIFLQGELQPLPGVPGVRQGDSRDAGTADRCPVERIG